MKKLMMMAMLLVASATAFAGDSDGLKAIMKAKTFAEADQLLKQNLSTLADNAEKAKAYNKLVDLAMKKVSEETGTITENQVAAQMGSGKEKAYDTLGLADAICQAIDAAVECEKYDQLPDAKGKVKPKFNEKNASRIWAVRTHLVNIGQEQAKNGNSAAVLKYWGAFTDSSLNPLFAAQDHKPESEYIGQVAFFAGRYAFDAKDFDRAMRYLDYAMEDPNQKAEALNFKLYAMRSNLKTAQDTLNCINQFKKLYEQDPSNEVVLDGLFSMYDKDKAAQKQLLESHLAKYPESFTATAEMGMLAIGENNAEKGAEWLRKAVKINPENAVVQTYLGTCLSVLAGNQDDQSKRKALYQEAVQALDKAKALDPNKQQANWGYNRYQAYYGLYGADDPKTKDAENDYKY
jgi:tetratricopeptide (TPR) repeat protein